MTFNLKPLEWDYSNGPSEIAADVIFGRYWTSQAGELTELRLDYALGPQMFQTFLGSFSEVADALATAEANYQSRMADELVAA